MSIVLVWTTACFSQHAIEIDATIDPDRGVIEVQQVLTYTNNSKQAIDRLYLYDWNHAYSDTSTPLSKKLADEFNFKLERSRSNEKGKTIIHDIQSNQKSLQWNRLKDQIDIVGFDIHPILAGESKDLFISYTLQLPSSSFTGYGVDSKQNISFRYGFLQFANQSVNGEWQLDSNYAFNDRSISAYMAKMSICFPESYKIIASIKGSHQQGCWHLRGLIEHNFNFYLKKDHDFRSIGTTSDFEIKTDMINGFDSDKHGPQITSRLKGFLERYFGNINEQYILVDGDFYEQHPIVGFDVLLNSLKPIPKKDQFELKAAQTILRKLVQSKFPGNFRQNKWIADGLSHYLFMRYVEEHFSTLSLIGQLSTLPLISSYDFAKAPFTAKTNLQAAIAYRKNLSQPLHTAVENLTKYNRKIANRSRSALGLKILEQTQGKETIDDFIFNVFTSKNLSNPMMIQDHFEIFFQDQASWFFQDYGTESGLTDYSIRQISDSNDRVQIELINPTKAKNPVNLNSYSGGKLVSSVWLTGGKEKQYFDFNAKNVDKIIVNPDQYVLETNTNNNSLLIGKKFIKREKRFRLFEDMPSTAYSSTYFSPNFAYNAYDGLMFGMILHNGLVLNQPTTVFISPLYGTTKKELTGSFSITHRSYFQEKKRSSISYRFGINSFHFDKDKRYIRIAPEILATFKPQGLSSNKRSTLGFRWISLFQENHTNSFRDFFAGSLSYTKANSNSAASKIFGINLQVGESFKKLAASYKNRKYYAEAKQYTYRLFLGILDDPNNSGNYDFGISRVNDYSFSYPYLGRSEKSGFFSQQYVLADAGFKSFIPLETSNQWVLSSNLSTTIWGSFEAYSDLGWVKNKGKRSTFIYDAGLSLNFMQDYLSIFFPIYSNIGWEVRDRSYANKIRFSLSLQAENIIALFTRSWF